MRSSHLGLALALVTVSCGGGAPDGVHDRPAASSSPAPAVRPLEPPSSEAPLVVFLGDSLTAGLGLEEAQAFPALLGHRLAAEGTPVRIVNAGVSGDTSAGGLRRLDWLLRQEPDLLVVELGVNDGLRGQPLDGIEANLRAIVTTTRTAGVRVLLLGIQVPPNYGPEYSDGFASIYPRVAADLGVALVPFLLEGVAGKPELNFPDGIHPTAEGHEVMTAVVLPALRELVAQREAPS